MTRGEFLGAGPLPPAERLILLCWALSVDRGYVYLHLDAPIPAGSAARLRAATRRRSAGWPIQYVTGEAWFWSLRLAVGPGVLVPRPETETLVEEAIAHAPHGARISDIGTGSGAVALALHTARPDLEITAIERSRRALRYARRNLPPEVHLVEGDLLAPLLVSQDVLVSNPPYVSESEYEVLPEDVRREPRAALLAGPDGLSTVRRLVRGGLRRLRPDGWLILEIGSGQDVKVQELFERSGYRDVFLRRDLAGLPRIVGGRVG